MNEPLLSESDKPDCTRSGSTREKQVDVIADVARFVGLSLDLDDEIAKVGKFVRRGSFVGLFLWIVLTLGVLLTTPPENFEYLEGAEYHASLMLLTLLIFTNGSRITSLAFRTEGFDFVQSGFMVGLLSVQAIAIVSVSLMCFLPTPVLVDPVTGMRMHGIRFSEWTALSFVMTFLTESVDLPLHSEDKAHSATRTAWCHGIAIALSTSVGLVFPHITDTKVWLTVFTISWVLFCSLFVRLYKRGRHFFSMTPGRTGSELEMYERTRFSFRLMLVCTVAWTWLAATFSLIALVPKYFDTVGTFWDNADLPLLSEHFFEALSKVWYLNVLIEAHEVVFDTNARAIRRLEDLRDIMTAVWENSSDVIARCSKTSNGRLHAVVSPAFCQIASSISDTATSANDAMDETLILDIDPENGAFRHFRLNLSKNVTRSKLKDLRDSVKLQKLVPKEPIRTVEEKNLVALASLLVDACKSETQKELSMLNFVARKEKEDGSSIEDVLSCEAQIKNVGSNTVLVMMRDISERYRQFELEKQTIEENTIRRKNDEANHFACHEIKNGLLAAIGLVDVMNETCPDPKPAGLFSSSKPPESELKSYIAELDLTLRHVLETLLDNVMSKQIIYDHYEPRRERVDIPAFFTSLHGHPTEEFHRRFPLIMEPRDIPHLRLDPQLVRCVYQNAMSNACKFGETNGVVKTIVRYRPKENDQFQMIVFNTPGFGHKDLVKLDNDERDLVFAPGTTLKVNKLRKPGGQERSKSESKGDGAWIAKRCASALGGKCEIHFQPQGTEFIFQCPAEICEKAGGKQDPRNTQLPEGTWGIAIDDSKIQRKLLARFLEATGIPEDRRRIYGETADEINGFGQTLTDLIRANPDDKFLVIVDENLDIVEGGAKFHTVSGSLCVEQARKDLSEEDERRMLAVVRSANDSPSNVATYRSRTHGILRKAPIVKGTVMDMVRPLWTDRFGDSAFSPRGAELLNEDTFVASSDDVMASLEVIDALIQVNEDSLRVRWKSIRDKLHILLGDLMTVQDRTGSASLLEKISSLQQKEHVPPDAKEQWNMLQASIRCLF